MTIPDIHTPIGFIRLTTHDGCQILIQATTAAVPAPTNTHEAQQLYAGRTDLAEIIFLELSLVNAFEQACPNCDGLMFVPASSNIQEAITDFLRNRHN